MIIIKSYIKAKSSHSIFDRLRQKTKYTIIIGALSTDNYGVFYLRQAIRFVRENIAKTQLSLRATSKYCSLPK